MTSDRKFRYSKITLLFVALFFYAVPYLLMVESCQAFIGPRSFHFPRYHKNSAINSAFKIWFLPIHLIDTKIRSEVWKNPWYNDPVGRVL